MRRHLAIVLLAVPAVNADVSSCPPITSDAHYFQPGSLARGRGGDDAFVREWFSKHLRIMEEPSLTCGSAPDEGAVYRFLWLRTFHNPIAVRVTVTRAVVTIDATELDGAGGYDPGKMLKRASRKIPGPDSGLIEANFKELWAYTPPFDEPGMDGSEWIFEARDHSRYKIVSVWSPTGGLPRRLGEYALSISGLDVPLNDRY